VDGVDRDAGLDATDPQRGFLVLDRDTGSLEAFALVLLQHSLEADGEGRHRLQPIGLA
jgi:hypothetical protein